ncbi:MAG: QueT transporter family protein [Longibaculum sp.]
MNKKLNVKIISMNAMIACVYAVLTIICSGISYGAIQLRFSEILLFLAFYNKKFIPGLVVGCFLANVPSPLGLADMIFGTFATVLACLIMHKVSKLYIGAILSALINGIIVGGELYFVLKLPFLINAFYVFVGEFVVLIIGCIVLKYLNNYSHFMDKYIQNL